MTRPIEDQLARALADTALRTVPAQTPRAEFAAPEPGRPRRPRWIAPALAAAAVVVVVVVAVTVSRGGATRSTPPVHPHPSLTTPTPHPSLTTPTPQPTGPPNVDPRWLRLRNAVIDVPAWKYDGDRCHPGPHRFVNGRSLAAHAFGTTYGYNLWIPPLAQYAQYGAPVFGDLDGKPGDEVLVELSCNGPGSVHPYVLLALAPQADGTYRTLGVVNQTPTEYLDFDPTTVRISNGTIYVDERGPEYSDGGPLAMEQERGYRYQNGTFVQVSGPASFPPLPTNIRDIDPRNTTWPLMFEDCTETCSMLYVPFTDGHGRAVEPIQLSDGTFRLVTYDYRIDQTAYSTGRGSQPGFALLTITRTSPDAPTVQFVYAGYAPAGFLGPAWPVVWTRRDGIRQIVSASGARRVVRVVVETGTGEQTRTYVTANYQTWTRQR